MDIVWSSGKQSDNKVILKEKANLPSWREDNDLHLYIPFLISHL